jgi:hypothetical protein
VVVMGLFSKKSGETPPHPPPSPQTALPNSAPVQNVAPVQKTAPVMNSIPASPASGSAHSPLPSPPPPLQGIAGSSLASGSVSSTSQSSQKSQASQATSMASLQPLPQQRPSSSAASIKPIGALGSFQPASPQAGLTPNPIASSRQAPPLSSPLSQSSSTSVAQSSVQSLTPSSTHISTSSSNSSSSPPSTPSLKPGFASSEDKDEMVTTGVDDLINLLNQFPKLSIDEVSRRLNVSKQILKSWIDFLVEEKILGIEYSFTTPYIYLNKPAVDDKTKKIKETKLNYVMFRQEFYEKARADKIPEDKIPAFWQAHLKPLLEENKEFFIREVKKRNLPKCDELWLAYMREVMAV